MPQTPQLSGSTDRLVQVWLFWHQVVPEGHWHLPPAHETPVGHFTPHVPQLPASLVVSVHFALHDVWPVGHWHLPETHAMPVGQAL